MLIQNVLPKLMLAFAQEPNRDVVHTGENKVLLDELQDPNCDISLEQKDKHILLGGQKQDIGAELRTH